MSRMEAIVWRRNRRPKVVRLRPNQTHFTVESREYHIDPDATVFGTYRKPHKLWLEKGECNRYYFHETFPKPYNPFDVMNEAMPDLYVKSMVMDSETGEEKEVMLPFAHSCDLHHSLCIKPSELAVIFKPRFYLIISKIKDTKNDLILYSSLAAAAIGLYVAWQINDLGGLIREALDMFTRGGTP